jgi:RecA/RadA recombinase
MTEPLSQLATLIEPVARILLGEPNRGLSSKGELRYGTRGSMSVDLRKGTWFDHETNEGGGTLDLIERQTGLHEAERFEWLSQNTNYQDEAKSNGHDRGGGKLGRVAATYPYVDEAGNFQFEVVRFDPKDFRQRRRARSDDDPHKVHDGWVWSVAGIRQVPYRLPEVIEAIASDRTIFITEGEKDCDKCWTLGLPATTNAGGAGKWRTDLDSYFDGADVVVLPDYDPQKTHQKTKELMFHPDGRPILPGQDHALAVAKSLSAVARRVRVLDLAAVWPGIKPKGDIADWIAAGGTADVLYALVEDVPDWFDGMTLRWPGSPVGGIEIPVTFPFPIDARLIPRRPWLIPGLLLRRQVTVMVAPPGSGKSLLTLQIAIVCAAGIPEWNGWRPRGRFRVLVINSEEDDDELKRRLWAAADAMRVPPNMLDGLAFADQPETIVVAKADSRTKTVIATPMLEQIVATIIAKQIDIVIVDPFAETFAGDENSNSELKWAAALWRKVARRTNAAVFLIHHTKKYAHDMAGDPDAGRGGGALAGVARIVATLFTMTEKEAQDFGFEEVNQRHKYIRFDDAKANLTLVTFNARWFFKKSVTLPNAGDGEPADEVGVLEPWHAPDALSGLTEIEVNKILDEIKLGVKDESGRPIGDPYSLQKTKDRWAGAIIQRYRPCSDEQAKKILKIWINGKLLETYETVLTNSKGAMRQGLKVIGRAGITSEERDMFWEKEDA